MMPRKISKSYAEISNAQAVRMLGKDLALKYLLQDRFKIYQARNGQYCIKYERRTYKTTDNIDSYGFSAQGIVTMTEELLGERK